MMNLLFMAYYGEKIMPNYLAFFRAPKDYPLYNPACDLLKVFANAIDGMHSK
jgi:hypothetical protein